MALQDRLMDNLRVQLPGALDSMIQMELFNTITDACREAWLWDEQQTVGLIPNEVDYLPAPEGTVIVHVYGVSHPTIAASDVVFEHGLMRLAVLPTIADAAEPMLMNVILAPAPGATDVEAWVPEDMWVEHHDMFMAGVLSRMMAQPAKPYSNPNMAAFWTRDYKSKRAAAKVALRNTRNFGAQRWRFPRFA